MEIQTTHDVLINIGKVQQEHEKRRLELIAQKVTSLEHNYKSLSDEGLLAKTNEFKSLIKAATHGITDEKKIHDTEEKVLKEILPEAFAAVREASKRTLGLRHHDVQIMGGVALHEGKIAEMKTGEGKTLVATLPLYLNALLGRGTHLVTVNDYLARRDARWMAPIFRSLGMTVGVLQASAVTENAKKAYLVDPYKESQNETQNQLQIVDRIEAYKADITYGTNSEFGFDYLRDNMTMRLNDRVQRGHSFAIVDEVDNILIDEARTPLIISGPKTENFDWYPHMAQVVKKLRLEDCEIKDKDHTISLTEIGTEHIEALLGQKLFDPEKPEEITPEQAYLTGLLEQALRAQYLFKRDRNYLVADGKVIIIDEFTGRQMPGRRWDDGLHQAIEAKENVRVESENITYATITLQNYFRMYSKLAGMSGTALTEAEEFDKVYSLKVVSIPPNQSDKRKDLPDVIYRTKEAKMRAIVKDIVQRHIKGQPLLVGTSSVINSNEMARYLNPESIRLILKTFLIRDAWLTKHSDTDDGQIIPELAFLNEPIDRIDHKLLNQLTAKLGIPLEIEEPENITYLQKILNLESNSNNTLTAILQKGIPYQVLNAKPDNVVKESEIIASAGTFGAVTIATNMAGRGVDIKLGGEMAKEVILVVNKVLQKAGIDDPFDMTLEERRQKLLNVDSSIFSGHESEIEFFLDYFTNMEKVKELGGLHIIGSERHEARRIDNQLKGRAARQDDPGSSQYYLSFQDDLMRMFGGDQVINLTTRVDDSFPLESRIVGKLVEECQARVEGVNFDVRKHLLEYDDVLNKQRTAIYSQRDRLFVKDNLAADISRMIKDEVNKNVNVKLAKDKKWPLKSIAWLENVQPPINTPDGIYPSYGFKLILEKFKPDTRVSILNIVSKASEMDFGYRLQEIKSDIKKFKKVFQIQTKNGEEINIEPLITVIQNYLGEQLQLPSQIPTKWNDLEKILIESVTENLEQRGKLIKDRTKDLIDNFFKNNSSNTDSNKIKLLLALSQEGRKITHPNVQQKAIQRSQLFSYIPYAAKIFENLSPKTVSQDINKHIEKAKVELQKAWGQSEFERIKQDAKQIKDFGSAAANIFNKEKLEKPLNSLIPEETELLKEAIGKYVINEIHRQLLLSSYSELWVEHLSKLEGLRISIGLEAYAQRDPLVQYKIQASEMFYELLGDVRASVVGSMFRLLPTNAYHPSRRI